MCVYIDCLLLHHIFTHQLGPRYKGQLMSDGGANSPFRSILLVLTHDFIITCVYGPTGSDEHERKDADAALRTIFVPFGVKTVCLGPRPASQRSPYTNYLRLGW